LQIVLKYDERKDVWVANVTEGGIEAGSDFTDVVTEWFGENNEDSFSGNEMRRKIIEESNNPIPELLLSLNVPIINHRNKERKYRREKNLIRLWCQKFQSSQYKINYYFWTEIVYFPLTKKKKRNGHF
jgi:hypothetical protein